MTIVDDQPVTGPAAPASACPASRPSRWLTRGATTWERPALASLLAFTTAVYAWALGSIGWANEYYAAAAQAATQSWTAWLFGSLDAGNAITVDKPPACLWVMGLSGRIFGFSPWSMLLPQALMGVATVALLYFAVRRTNGVGAGLIAGTALALTPVAALMFRYNNPDALLVLLLVGAAYCVIRALDGNPTRWVALAGFVVGFAFLTKLLQAFLVLPAFALVVLVALPGSFWHRLRVGLVGVASAIIGGGWLVALVGVWPAGSRPYIGGSTDNSLLQLALGYNGIGRVVGGSGNPTGGSGGPGFGPGAGTGSGPGPGPGPGNGFGGDPGWLRLFGDAMGTEIAWLLPAALIALIAGLWLGRGAARTDTTRAALLLWGGWLFVTAVVFSHMKGIMHPYYAVALAPAIAAIAGIGVHMLWTRRDALPARLTLAGMLALTGVWSFVLLGRTPEWLPWLRWVLLVGALVAAVLLVAGLRRSRTAAAIAAAALVVGLGGSGAYTLATVGHTQDSSMPASGPVRTGEGFGPGHGPGMDRREVANRLREMLIATDHRWAAATTGSHSSGALQLSSGRPVMAIGGFTGSDNAPTLEQFQRYVRDGQVRYFVVDDRGPGKRGGSGGPGDGRPRGPGGRGGSSTAITEWVQANFTASSIEGTTVFDLQR
ncbi:hypothetical protein GOARA_066_00040 [Gordonia araii NBRC 100433]|uniref:Uncharacterized protein n=1 Tax=Gordonia araii NBRC 100433 TaxID=1073574 RepID=G7H5X8_9ACTN|nr:glycosyltransferase family 39 protein [Gordonia araii]NNG98747.1 glycosyltransferase family 39 protein [Gordonia araii NBRC 100433]GAB11253.1 hypothetical protein GOARA_066_00040 [Gordonia araii NBRC 100433]